MMPNYMNQVDKLWAVDLDRTLIDTSKAVELLADHGQKLGLLKPDDILAVASETELSGGSFDVLQFLRDEGLSEDEIVGICTSMSEEPQEILQYGDGVSFLQRIAEKGDQCAAIATHGSEQWQVAKMSAAGLSLPYIFTDQYKGDTIQSWRDTDRNYRVGLNCGNIVIANTISLVDDKAISFTGIPADCEGWWIRRNSSNPLPSQFGLVPPNVITINSLSQIHLDR